MGLALFASGKVRGDKDLSSKIAALDSVLGSRMLFFSLRGSPTTDGRSDGADASLEAAATADLGW